MRPCGRLARVRRPSLAFVIVSLLALPGFDWPGGSARLNAALRDPSPERRREAVREAAASPDAEARRVVLSALDDADEQVRLDAAAAVTRMRFTEAAPALSRWLDAPSAALRLAATRGLGTLRASASLASLTRMLADADVGVRSEAVRAVSSVGGVDGTVALLDRLSDPEAAVRVETARALGELGDRRAVFTLLGALQDPAVEVRAASAEALGRLRDPRAQRGLVSALHDTAIEARTAAVVALGALGRDVPDAVADLAVVALREGREWEPPAQSRLAIEAINALGSIGTAPACDVLVEVIRRGGEQIDRTPVYVAFRALSGQRELARTRLPTLVAVTAPEFVDMLMELLGVVGGDDAARVLLRYLERTDLAASTRSRAIHALGRSGSSLALLPLVAEADHLAPGARPVSGMRDCTRLRLNPLPLIGLASLSTVAGTLGPDSLDLLGALLDRVGDACATQSAQVVVLLGRTGNSRAPARIRPLLSSPSQIVRRAAVHALVEAGVEGAERDLAALLGDPSPAVRLAASDALSRHGGGAAVTALLDRWQRDEPIDRTAAARALGRSLRGAPAEVSARAVETLTRCVRESPFAVAAACVDALSDAASRAPGDSPALTVILSWLDAREEARTLVALEALANAASTASDPRLASHIRSRVERALSHATIGHRARVTLRWLSSTEDEALDALSSGAPDLAANAIASLRHTDDALPPRLTDALWEALRTRHHEAVLVNAALLLARHPSGAVDLETLTDLLAHHPSDRVRAAVATLARALPEASLDAPARGRLAAALDRCATGAGSTSLKARCDTRDARPTAPERAAIDARVVDANGAARASADYALVLPEGWIRMGTTGPDGWIHERAASEGTFSAIDPSELADAP